MAGGAANQLEGTLACQTRGMCQYHSQAAAKLTNSSKQQQTRAERDGYQQLRVRAPGLVPRKPTRVTTSALHWSNHTAS
jgi:hypothetical protein